jgi:hypothetical protein
MLGIEQPFNQNSGLMNNSSFNQLFSNLDETSKNMKPNSFMIESGEKRNNLIIETFAIPNLAPQESHYAELKRNLSNYNRTRNNDSEFLRNGGSIGSNDSMTNLQKNLQDFRLSGSIKSNKSNRDPSDEGRNSSMNWVEKLTIKEESFNKNGSESRSK